MHSFDQGTSLEMPNATRWSLRSTCHNCSRFLACNMAWAVLPACFLPCCAPLAMVHYCLPWKCWERFWGEKEDLHACGCGSALWAVSASASPAEDEGLLHLSPEAYISLTDSHFGRTGKAVEKVWLRNPAGAPRWEEAMMDWRTEWGLWHWPL